MKYLDEIMRGNELLAKHPKTIVVGQSVLWPGHAMTATTKFWTDSRKIETPVFEDIQMGISTGLALEGYIPVSIYPRWNFLLLATNQLINHLDKIPLLTRNEITPKVIVRVSVGSERPMHPGWQHTGNLTKAFQMMCQTVVLEDLQEPEQIYPAYQDALERNGSTVLVEHGDFYNEK